MRLSAFYVLFLTCQGSLLLNQATAQSPVADFTAPSSACLQATLPMINQSTNASHYVWDFCDRDLTTVSSFQIMTVASTAVTPLSVRTIYDKGNWYGFLASRDNNSFIRLDFGNSLDNDPAITDLGNPGGLLSQPGNIDFVEEGSIWYGLVANRATGSLVRLKFTNGLSNAPTAQDVGTMGHLASLADLEIIKDGSTWKVVATNYGNNLIHVIDFGISITNFPTTSDVLDVSDPLLINPYGLQVEQSGGTWFVLVASSSGAGVVRLQFDNGLMSQPASGSTIYPVSSSTDLSLDLEGGEYRMYVSTISGDLHYVNIGSSLSATPVSFSNLGNLGILNNTYGFSVARATPEWRGFTVDYASKRIFRLVYRTACGGIPKQSSVETNPTGMVYTQAGAYSIDLTAYAADEQQTSVQKSLSVSGLTAPDIQIASQNNCAGNAVNFFSTNLSGNLVSYAWNFGDGQLDSNPNPTNIYSTAGIYVSSLKVTASNGCANYGALSLPIYNAPVADFTLPSGSPVCTNQNYLFSNSSTFDAGSNPTWEWRVNGTLTSTQKDLTVIFNSPIAQDIKLKALIPGCSNEIIKPIASVLSGPAVSFSVSDNCSGATVPFVNTTTGSVTGYQWSFGDGATSNLISPSHIYSSPSTYQAILTANNAAGCQNSASKQVTIYSLPQPDFSVNLPPFSCANSPTQFQNNTPTPTDSNITGWNWIFGDGGTSSQQTPVHTFSIANTYNSSLTATTNKGCSATLNKSIVIAASPAADFTVGPSCVNLSTKFTDASSGNIQSRLWQIASSTFSIPNPSYTFVSPGDYPATLTVTSPNGCINVKSKTVKVPIAPTVNFTNSPPCAGKNMVFTDATVSPQDLAVGWNWNFAGNSATGNPASFTFSPDGLYNVKLTTTHASGCSYTLSRNITINPSPVASFTATPDRGSAPLTVQFNSTSQQATNYSWKFYDKITATSTQPSPVYTFTALGDYSTELTVGNTFGCTDVISTPIKVLIPAIDLIMKDFSTASDPLTGKLKGVVTISNNSNIPIALAEVALFLADKAVVNETLTVNLAPGQSAVKTLSFTVSPNQFDLSYLCAELLANADVQPDNNKRCIMLDQGEYVFSPYPNPTSGTLHVDWISPAAGSARLTIYDGMGRKSYEWATASQSGLNQGVLDISFLTAGIYYLTIETGTMKKSLRFLRE